MKNQLTRALELGFLFILLFTITACGDDDNAAPSYIIPISYNFENVNFSGQQQRLAQMTEFKIYMATTRNIGQSLDAGRLQAMFANDVLVAEWQGTYDDSKKLSDKTFALVQDDFTALLDELAMASQSDIPGSDGVSGVVESLDGADRYLLGDDGLDHAQLIEKGLMGACFYYQATAVYMGEEKMNVDNEIIEPGEGTQMEHHWDEAFGYLGVPIDFPINQDGLFFWGSYSSERDAILGSNRIIMDAMLKGRAAISNDDLATRDEAIREAREIWELIAVGSALHYLNAGIANFDDKAVAFHALSEGIGFIYALQFNPSARISNNQVDDLLTLIAGSSKFSEMDLYGTSVQNLQQAQTQLALLYNLTDKKDAF